MKLSALLFADASYWIALSNPKDSLHGVAVRTTKLESGRVLVTTEMVLTEWLNAFSRPTKGQKNAVILQYMSLRGRRDVEIIPQTPDLFHQAFLLYAGRSDKAWSLTDCASFVIMNRRRIKDALTFDHHFEQAGFRALLR